MPAAPLAAVTAIAAGALLLAPGVRAAGPPIMTLDQVQVGMRCTVASVVRGTDVATFDARVEDVLRSRDPTSTRLLVRVSGPAIDATGIGPGFSGSPISCTGIDGVPRIAAAISEGIGEYGGKLALATPIEAILGEPADPPAGARVASALLRRARPLAEPLTMSGLAPPLAAAFSRAAARAHRTLVVAPAIARAAQEFPVPLVPGSAVAVSMATGDVTSGAIGTVAYVDGDRVWAFGHALDGAGRRSLTLSNAYVSTVVSNPVASSEDNTYKLASPLADIGTLVQDGVNAVVGRVGPLPRRYPLRVVTRDLDRGIRRELGSQVADERPVGSPTGGSGLAVLASALASQAAYVTLQGLPANLSGRVCLRVALTERRGPLGFCSTYVGAGGGPEAFTSGPVVADLAAAAKLLDAYDAGPLRISSVTIGMRLTRALRLGTLVRATAPALVRRGTTARVTLTLRRAGGGRFTRDVLVSVPRTMPVGTRDLLLTGTAADGPLPSGGDISLSDLFSTADVPPPPSTLPALASAIASLHRDDGLGARFLHRGAPAPTRLPGGAEGIAERRRVVFRSDALRIAGRVRVALRVR